MDHYADNYHSSGEKDLKNYQLVKRFRNLYNHYAWNYGMSYDENDPDYHSTKVAIYDQVWDYENKTTGASSSSGTSRPLTKKEQYYEDSKSDRCVEGGGKTRPRVIRKSML